jgi:hypothetical protein
VGGALSLVLAGTASAGPAAWCKGAQVGDPNIKDLSSKTPRDVIKAFVAAECSPNAEVEAHRGEIEKARDAWTRKLGMTEADWAGAVPYAQASDDYSIAATVETKTLASASPIDQYAVIMKTQDNVSDAPIAMDAFYATDMFESKLSEVARFAFLKTSCFEAGKLTVRDDAGMVGSEAWWAVCQQDFEKLDLAKFFSQIRADSTHGGAIKMKLRVAAYDLPALIKDHAAKVAEAFKRDDANKKLFEIAAGARNEWTSTLGKDTQLLDLTLAMESATIAQSRKQFDGCADTTQAALASTISEIPAKKFEVEVDDRKDWKGEKSFMTTGSPVLAAHPRVMLAMIPWVLCSPKAELATYMTGLLDRSPGARGPRNAAFGKLRATPVTYDSVNAKLRFPELQPYSTHYTPPVAWDGAGTGGVIKAIKPSGDVLKIDLERTTESFKDCLKSHKTGRISKLESDGRVRYEEICDKAGTVTRDNTWTGLEVLAKYAKQLKPGVRYTAIGKDVLAVWPSKTAKVPSFVLGAPVK